MFFPKPARAISSRAALVCLVFLTLCSNAFYMTLVLDLKNNKEHFTSIIGYANETPQTNSLEADIVSARYLD